MSENETRRPSAGRRPARRAARFAARLARRAMRVAAVGLGLLSLASAGSLFFLTQTPWGRSTAADLISGVLQGTMSAHVRLGPILGGNLLTRAVVERFEIRGLDGELFVAVDSARIEYDPTGFFTQNFSFRSLDARRMIVRLHQYADGSWNYQRIFSADEAPKRVPPPEVQEDGGLRLVFRDARVEDGRFEVRRPYLDDLSGAELREAAAAALAGEGVWIVEAAEAHQAADRGTNEPGETADLEEADAEAAGVGAPNQARYEQVIRLDSIRAGFPLLRLVDPRRPMQIEIHNLTGRARAVTQPLEVLGFDGSVTIADTVAVDVGRLELPSSRLRGAGWVVPASPVQYRFDLAADPAGFADLQWLPVPMPSEGGGAMDLVLRSEGETMVVEAEGDEVRTGDSRFAGSFALALEETPRFERMAFTLSPLRVSLVNDLLDRPELIDGYLRGEVTGAGRIDGLRIEAEVSLADLAGEVPESRLSAVGGVSLVEPYTLRELELGFRAFEPRWTAVLGFEVGLDGRVDGVTTLSGVPGGLLEFEGDVYHARAGATTSHLIGGGTWDLGETSVIDLSVMVDPLSLSLIDPYLPDADLVGEIRGPIEASGGLADLQARARLQTPRGQLSFDGRFDLAAEERRYEGEIIARGIDLAEWKEGAPETQLDVQGRVQGVGTDPATLSATLDLRVMPSVFKEARVDTSRIHFTVDGGLATVETFVVNSDVGVLRGRGSFGLAADQSGALVVVAGVSDLSTWNRWLLEEIPETEVTEEADDPFADLGPFVEVEAAAEGEETQGLSGRLAARGVLFGNLEEVSFSGELASHEFRYDGHSADSLVARLDVPDPTVLDSLTLEARAWNVTALGERADSVVARWARLDAGRADLRFYADRDTAYSVALEGGVEWGDEGYAANLEILRLQAGEHELRLASPARLAYGDSGLAVADVVLAGRYATLRAEGEIPADGSGRLSASLEGLQLAEAVKALPTSPDVGGVLSGELRITGTVDAPQIELSLEIEEPRLRARGHSRLTAELSYADRTATGVIRLLEGARVLARIDGSVRSDLSLVRVEDRLPEDAFDFRIAADSLPAGLLEPWVGGLQDLEGYVRGEVEVGGDPEALRLGGRTELLGAGGTVPNLGIRLVDAVGTIEFDGSVARLRELEFASRGATRRQPEGRGRVSGEIDLAPLGDPGFALELSADELRAMDRYELSILLDGSGRLGGSYRSPDLTGRFRIRDGDIRQDEFLRSREVIDLTDPDVYSLIDTTMVAERRLLEQVQNPFMQNLRMEMQLDLGPNLWLRSETLDVELTAEAIDLLMDRASGSLAMVGTVEIVRGNYIFDALQLYRTTLRVTEGTITFVGTPGLDPNIDITAEYRTRTRDGPVTVWARITGTMRQTELTTTSNPPTLAESDRLCFLAIGAPCFGAADERLGNRLAQEAITGVVSSSLSSALVGSSGLSYVNLRSAGTTDAAAVGLGGDQDFFSRTEIELGWYAGEDVFFSVAQPLGSGVPRIVVEWRFSENWTLEARAENRFDSQQFGFYRGSNIENQQTYGLFIFREWAYP